ncbi:MAG: hypothetical protein JRI36_03585 [Deltaproteobacteria bacterium]|nr:hypothetical protein [Deltaproteobacteria bacterium]
MDCADTQKDPWHFVTGGGDIDHCLVVKQHGQILDLAPDPYAPVYRAMAAFVIEQEVLRMPVAPHPGVVLKMGDIASECPSPHDVNFVHHRIADYVQGLL